MKIFNIRYILIGVLLIALIGVIIQKQNHKNIDSDSVSAYDIFSSKMSQINLDLNESKSAYAYGITQSMGLNEYISREFGIDTLQLTKFSQGVFDGYSNGNDSHKRAYYAGIQIGNQISNQMIYGINHEVFGEDSTKSISRQKFMAGFLVGTLGKNGLMTMDAATQIAQELLTSVKAKNLMGEFGSNKEAGEHFLTENAKKDGIQVLPSGVQYKILKEGRGAVPTESSLVKVHYEGKTLDGKVFDSSYERGQAIEVRPNQTIKGWTEALTHMPAGSIWEVYIPQELAYAEREQGDIKPFSMLIFKMELLEVK